MTEQNITAHEWPLRKVFSADFDFRIPSYQRPYRWGPEQAIQLLDDLEETLDRGGGEPYFLGSLVLVTDRSGVCDVIDGQQRLTTLTILLAVLRDLADDPDNERVLADMVMEKGVALDGIPPKPRLRLRSQDVEFFRDQVQTPGTTPSLVALSSVSAPKGPQRNIRDNAVALRERLQEWDDTRRSALATLLRTRTYLVVVSTPQIYSAYRIFSVMNARGLDLAPSDIFKSQALGHLDEDSVHAKKWEETEQVLGTDGFTDLFRDIRTVVTGERARVEILKEFPAQVLDAYVTTNRSAEFVDDLLLPYATAFEYTVTQHVSSEEDWYLVNASLRRLARIDNKDWRSVALWSLVTFKDEPGTLGRILARLERVAAMFLLRGTYTTPRIERYLDLLQELKDGAADEAPGFTLTEDEKAAARIALDGDIYNLNVRRARYVLLRLDELLADEPGATYSHAIISIEHVLPQNPDPSSQWATDFDDDARELWTHRLGNLLLLNRRKNSQARNYDFDKKKERYFSTTSGSALFALTTQVLQHDSWDPSVVEGRHLDLTNRLVTEWELN